MVIKQIVKHFELGERYGNPRNGWSPYTDGEYIKDGDEILAVKLRHGKAKYLVNGSSNIFHRGRRDMIIHLLPNDSQIQIPFEALKGAEIEDLEKIVVIDTEWAKWRWVECNEPTEEQKEMTMDREICPDMLSSRHVNETKFQRTKKWYEKNTTNYTTHGGNEVNDETWYRLEHLLGGTLFKYGGRYYLSGVDSSAKWGFGYFLTRLPKSHGIRYETTEQAYMELKPKELRYMTEDKDYQRQGEFFFLPKPTIDEKTILPTAVAEYGEPLKKPRLRGGVMMLPYQCRNYLFEKGMNIAQWFNPGTSGHSHNATYCGVGHNKELYVRGTVRHPEHEMKKFGDVWHQVYINRAEGSWNAPGKID